MHEQDRPTEDELGLAPVTVVSRKRPKALWGVLAAVAVAAGALAVTSGGGEEEAAPLLPIALGAAAGERGTPASAADSMLAWVTYVPGDDLPPLGGEAPAYRLSGSADEAEVRALAAALGLDGDVERAGGGLRIAGTDGAALEVSDDGAGSWWFSAGPPDLPVGRAGVDDCVETTVEGGSVTDCSFSHDAELDCVAPEGAVSACPPPTTLAPLPPTDLPSEEEARAIALELLAVTGVGSDDAIVTVDGPYDAWFVTVEPRIDGTPSGLVATVSIGGGGAILSADGHLASPERLGDYPLLDTRAAIERLNEMGGAASWSSGSTGVARDLGVASDDVVDTTTTVVPTTVPPCSVQADGSEICEGSGSTGRPAPDLPKCPDVVAPADEPQSSDGEGECIDVAPVPLPMPEPEPSEVVLSDATPVLLLVPANDGSADAYLVPGYRFVGDDGVSVDASAVADAALTGSPTTEPPVDPPITGTSLVPDPGGTDGGSTPPSGCEPLVEEDSAGTTHTIQPCVGLDPMVSTAVVGVAYQVDVDLGCGEGAFSLGGRTWHVDEADWATWDDAIAPGEAFEGGTFTLSDPSHGTFVGDAASTKQAGFHIIGQAEDLFCVPAERP